MTLKPCFPYFGSKRPVAKEILKRFGIVSNYIEPFAGSLAVLLANTNIPKIETVNDKDCFLANFWRALSKDPEGVAKFADYPVNEADLHARHKWLLSEVNDEFIKKMHSDPDFYDVKIAGYWVWGISSSIPGNWLEKQGENAMPLLSSAGGGINGLTHKIPDWFDLLSKRLRRVRVTCGDWKKIITPGITYKSKGISNKDITAVLLDPPYALENRAKVYKEDNNIFKEVCDWAIENGENPNLRIAVCGYDSEDIAFPETWDKFYWKTNGGLSNQGKENTPGKINSKKETIWFNKSCINNQ